MYDAFPLPRVAGEEAAGVVDGGKGGECRHMGVHEEEEEEEVEVSGVGHVSLLLSPTDHEHVHRGAVLVVFI